MAKPTGGLGSLRKIAFFVVLAGFGVRKVGGGLEGPQRRALSSAHVAWVVLGQ